MSTKAGIFITLEGGEGAGKSTQRKHIVDWLARHGQIVVETREPGGTIVSEHIRKLLLDTRNHGLEPTTELLLMFAARAQLLHEVIRPALALGKIVLSDRFTDASYAYQGGGRELGPEKVAVIENFVHPDLQPDLTLLFDIPVNLGMSRVAGRGESDRFELESLQFFNRVRQAYLQRASGQPDRFKVIDASGGQSQVWQQVKAALKTVLET